MSLFPSFGGMRYGSNKTVGCSPTARLVGSSTGVGQGEGYGRDLHVFRNYNSIEPFVLLKSSTGGKKRASLARMRKQLQVSDSQAGSQNSITLAEAIKQVGWQQKIDALSFYRAQGVTLEPVINEFKDAFAQYQHHSR